MHKIVQDLPAHLATLCALCELFITLGSNSRYYRHNSPREGRKQQIEAFTTGTLAGAGSFRCESCGYAIALQAHDEIPHCPHCHGGRFRRSSMFEDPTETAVSPRDTGEPDWLGDAREALVAEGDYLAYEDDERVHVVPLEDEWTRIGRSLAAHIRLDDPTVSRRHAILHRGEGGARILDDRSLNGVFVNGRRSEWHELRDRDELAIGRYRLYFMTLTGDAPTVDREEVGSAVG
jgi:FHA domain-containing protein/zinc ribbon family protein